MARMTSRWQSFRLVAFLTFIVGVQSVAPAEPDVADASDGAAAVHRDLLESVTAIEAGLPQLTASAERAAKRFVEEDLCMAVAGDVSFVRELQGRSGGLMRLEVLPADGGEPWRGVVLYALGRRSLDDDVARIAALNRQGCHVVGFATRAVLDDVLQHGGATLEPIEVPVAKRPAGSVVVLDGAAGLATAWAWTAEFVAACTRLGKMPTMYLGFINPGGEERAKRIGDAKFHERSPLPVEPGALGRQYLATLRKHLIALRDNEMNDILAAAGAAAKARSAGRGIFVITHGHATGKLLGSQYDPGVFAPLDRNVDPLPLQRDDFVLYIGYSYIRDGKLPDLPARLRQAGATIVWSIATYRAEETAKIPPEEILIGQQWTAPDADVTVPGYDIKILPTSGVLAQTVFLMTSAEVHARAGE